MVVIKFESACGCAVLKGGGLPYELAVGGADAAQLSPCARLAPDAGLRRDLAEALYAEAGGFDVLACPRCGDRLELIALIEEPRVIRRILSHRGLPTEVPAARPARPPPLPLGRSEPRDDDDIAVP